MKRKSVFSKLAVLLLAAVMVVSLLPAAALAADPMYFEVVIDGATTQYATAGEAYTAVEAALPDGGRATIRLLDNYTGGGLIVKADKNLDLTFDLNGNTWTVTDPLVGSAGTETNAFQLNKGNTVTFQNGAVTSSVARILFQNYCDLTVDNVDVTLTTTTLGSYAMSNNNASTFVKGGSVIEVTTEGNFAMDSFNFGSTYTGGNVTIEDAEIKGNVEIANGGKLKLDGGTIEGDVSVYSYRYDDNVNKPSSFTMESGTVTGNVATSEIGSTTINGGEVIGEVTLDTTKDAAAGSAETAAATVTGGIFGSLGDNVAVNAADTAVITSGGDTKTLVGLPSINEALETAGQGDTIRITKAAEGSEISAPVGVLVENQSDHAILVNGEALEKNASVVVEDKTNETPETPENDKPGTDAPATGDPRNMVVWAALALFAACGLAGTAVIVKKRAR